VSTDFLIRRRGVLLTLSPSELEDLEDLDGILDQVVVPPLAAAGGEI